MFHSLMMITSKCPGRNTSETQPYVILHKNGWKNSEKYPYEVNTHSSVIPPMEWLGDVQGSPDLLDQAQHMADQDQPIVGYADKCCHTRFSHNLHHGNQWNRVLPMTSWADRRTAQQSAPFLQVKAVQEILQMKCLLKYCTSICS